MRYIGSKATSIPRLFRALAALPIRDVTLCDPFAGICTVARRCKEKNWRVITGDSLHLSYVLQVAHVRLNRPPQFRALLPLLGQRTSSVAPHLKILNHLNALPGNDGFITKSYSVVGEARRKFFSASNARRIDTIRTTIGRWSQNGLLSEDESCYLLAALLEAADRVASTAGTYYAFLKRLYRKALRPLSLQPPRIHSNRRRNHASRCDALALVAKTSAEILYLDPPYNDRDYSSYYHLPETLVIGRNPEVRGRAGLPQPGAAASRFCRPSEALPALRSLLDVADFRFIVLHYATKGLMDHSDILDLLNARGKTRFSTWRVRSYTTTPSRAFAGNRLYVCRTR